VILKELVEVLHQGESNGNNMLIRIKLPSGAEILGLPTENYYGGEWDLGPTWNYLVLKDRPFLVDTGKSGMGLKLLEMMESAGISGNDLEYILLSHGHEDHDGGLSEMVKSTGVKVKAHAVYDRLIRFFPGEGPSDFKKDFPASCWHCFMPESFSTEHCRAYHAGRKSLSIEKIGDGESILVEGTSTFYLPGHSPDALAVLIGEDALIVGDTLLPQITPIPSREAFFEQIREILGPEHTSGQPIYGLKAYLRSLKKMKQIGKQLGDLLVLPAHRLFYGNQWNEIDLEVRVSELIDHHIARCADILRILEEKPKAAKEIALEHFEESLLRGMGILMAENEILSHCEFLSASNDIVSLNHGRFEATGTSNFESLIRSLDPW
jgi:glyoxylase-like metal-dependent hydrolase (beta-lactamase superfamily II)